MPTKSRRKKRKTSSQKSFSAGFNAAVRLFYLDRLRAAKDKGGKR